MAEITRELATLSLLSLPGVGPKRFARLLERCGDATIAWATARRDGSALERWLPDVHEWPPWAEPDRLALRIEQRATLVLLPDDPRWPLPHAMQDPPALLLAEGDGTAALTATPRVAIVGTRAASPHGLADAREIAQACASAGYVVVSGMAIGIDGAAHRGAIDVEGLTIGVVATGLDIEYPVRHRELYRGVRAHGLVLGEYPFGLGVAQHRFPVRNRIIAALSAVVVVVEARATGGALNTAALANDMDHDVMVVPGSRRNPACAGTNALLRDGAEPVLDPSDVLLKLGARAAITGWSGDASVVMSEAAATVHAAFAGEAATLDELAVRTRFDLGRLSGALRELERSGQVERLRGQWWPR